MKLDPYFSPHTKISSKWIKGLSQKPEMLNLQEENIRKAIQDMAVGENFLNITLKTGTHEIRFPHSI